MIVSNISADTLRAAAAAVGVEIETNPLSGTGRRHSVKLNPQTPPELYTPGGYRRKGDAGDARYQRESVGYGTAGRRVHAVCWHGFRDFFRACFAAEPEAKFYTALDKWLGSEDFEARYRDSGHRNAGPPIAPVCVADTCRCPERGRVI